MAQHLGIVFPTLRDPALLDLGILLPAVPLLGDPDERGIDDMPVLQQETAASQRLVEPREEPVEDALSAEFLAEAPERVLVRHRVGEREADKALEAPAVRQLELRLLEHIK